MADRIKSYISTIGLLLVEAMAILYFISNFPLGRVVFIYQGY